MASKPDPNAWMVTFSDLITLLLTFFVMLISMSSLDNKEFKESFGLLTESMSVVRGGGGGMLIAMNLGIEIPRNIESGVGTSHVRLLNTRNKIADALEDILKDSTKIEGELITAKERLIVRLPEMHLFEEGSTRLSPRAIDDLTSIAETLKRIPPETFPISIEGYADAGPPDRELFSNRLEMSSARAYVVLQALLAAGMKPERLCVYGHGAGEPVLAFDPKQPGNRRVEIIIHLKEEEKDQSPTASADGPRRKREA